MRAFSTKRRDSAPALAVTARLSLVQQARAFTLLTERILSPRSEAPPCATPSTALLLQREALRLSLLALEPADIGAREPELPLSALFRHHSALLANLQTPEATVATVEQTLVHPDLATLAERRDPRAELDARRVQRLLSRLLSALPDPDAVRLRIRRRRVLSWLAALLALALLPLAIQQVGDRVLYGPDLAAQSRFRTSSTYPGFSAKDGTQESRPSKLFFHTGEDDSPWIEYDLGRVRSIRRIHVENRRDCCADRAVPLLFEVSLDQREFQEVARSEATFSEFDVRIPKTKARYVRLRVPHRSYLHLERVVIR